LVRAKTGCRIEEEIWDGSNDGEREYSSMKKSI